MVSLLELKAESARTACAAGQFLSGRPGSAPRDVPDLSITHRLYFGIIYLSTGQRPTCRGRTEMTDTAADQPSRFQVSAIYQYDPRPTATGTRVRMCYGIANASGYYSEWSSRELAEAAVASERARIAAGGPAPAGLDPDSFQIRHMKPVTPSATDLAAIQAGLDRGQRMMSALSEGEGAADEDN